MRNCPICSSSRRDLIASKYDSNEWSLYRCSACAMLYLDAEAATQQSMNEFYNMVYRTDDDAYSEERLTSLANYVVESVFDLPIMDVGGMDGKLAAKLKECGFTDVSVSGPGAVFDRNYHIFILSHTLEHVYNPGDLLDDIYMHLSPNGWVIVEVPIWQPDSPYTYDYHFQHINKFTPWHLESLFTRLGFTVEDSRPLPDYREYKCHRLTAKAGTRE